LIQVSVVRPLCLTAELAFWPHRAECLSRSSHEDPVSPIRLSCIFLVYQFDNP